MLCGSYTAYETELGLSVMLFAVFGCVLHSCVLRGFGGFFFFLVELARCGHLIADRVCFGCFMFVLDVWSRRMHSSVLLGCGKDFFFLFFSFLCFLPASE
jgi:hypothetical protein